MPAPRYAMSALQDVLATASALSNRPLVRAASKVVKLASSLVFSRPVLYETALIIQTLPEAFVETGKRGRFYIDVYDTLSRDRYAGVA